MRRFTSVHCEIPRLRAVSLRYIAKSRSYAPFHFGTLRNPEVTRRFTSAHCEIPKLRAVSLQYIAKSRSYVACDFGRLASASVDCPLSFIGSEIMSVPVRINGVAG